MTDWRDRRAKFRPRTSGGFTLLEVMVALMLATIGLLGTVAVQHSIFAATSNAGDAAVATRLATRAMEEYDAKIVTAGPPVLDQMAAATTPSWIVSGYQNALGGLNATPSTDFRFKREVQVLNLGPAQPYNISVRVTYALDTGAPKIVRLDSQRWKTW
ncbi:MAG: prepilin-type N-terminal cleavage/methylation domain-containing protein [Deltaproteobacteria bacterium]|nr:prepilin-type N-terminal cleavage/methylation domain-containing protein [Deltaproteobacteria bacterium]